MLNQDTRAEIIQKAFSRASNQVHYQKAVAASYYLYKEVNPLSCVKCKNYLGFHNWVLQPIWEVTCLKCQTFQIHKNSE